MFKIKKPCLVKLNKVLQAAAAGFGATVANIVFAPSAPPSFAKSAIHGRLPQKMLQVFAFFGSLTSVQNLP